MAGPVIRWGDKTSHDGVVVSGDPSMIVDAKPVARPGDKISCSAPLVANRPATVDQV